ncbi:MAG TPA: capsule assembly Wzi family protein, partial [Pirellulales bacterium]
AVDFGFGGRYGPLSFVIAPEAFRAENQGFGLQPSALSNIPVGLEGEFSDPFSPIEIDQPQRFGTKAYQRLDPGQSTVRLDIWHLAVGVGTEDQFWGPAVTNPILLGNNAAGFRHLFAGVRSLNLGVAHLDANVVWGRLDQSFLMPDVQGTRKRFMSGLVATATINGLPGLEFGFGRFFETIWPDSGLTHEDFLRPFNAFFKATRAQQIGGTGDEPDNQLASIFARWMFPGAGVEIYGEYGREDYNADLPDLIGEPDHDASYMIGLQRVWKRKNAQLIALRGEVLNTRMTSLNIVRGQAPFYEHTPVAQGFTEQGQVLGAFGAHGGGAANISVDWYRPDGKWTFEWSRTALGERVATGPNGPQAIGSLTEVMHALSAERLLFWDRYAITLGLDEVFKFNETPNSVVGNTRVRAGIALR